MENLQLWQTVQQTDPKFTKEFNRGGGFKGTAVNPTWLVKRATETFGPIGIGWGYTIQDEAYQKGHAIVSDDGRVIGEIVIHKIRLEVWYIWEGQLGRVQQFGQTEFVGKNKYGMFTDEEAPKKSLTDALSKCLSLLGFSSDVHMGMFDDNKYVNSLKDGGEATNNNAPAKDKNHGEARGSMGVTELKKKVGAFIDDLSKWTDPLSFEGFLDDNAEIIIRCQNDLPGWWRTKPGSDVLGLEDRIKAKREQLEERQAA